MTRRRLGLAISAACLATALLWWAEILYRVWLFVTDYGMVLYTNHVDDWHFTFAHVVLGCLLVSGTIVALLLRKEGKFRAAATLVPMGLGILAWAGVLLMHRTGILIGYAEMMGRVQGGQP